jgi:hypothetical protein
MGQRILRVEDDRFLRGAGLYVENEDVPDALHATFVRSPYAHARIVGIDTSVVSSVPGAQVFTAADVPLPSFPPPPIPGLDQRMARPFLAGEVVRFVGDIVAVVLTESRADGVDAAELVMVDYEPLPVVVDPEAALAGDVILFPETGTNVCASHPVEAAEALFEGCDVVVSGRMVSQRMAACPLEPRGCVATIGEDGRPTLRLSTQTPHLDRHVLGLFLGLTDDDVRVIAPDVGGGFGAKGLSVETVIVPWLARTLGRPVRWTESRSENMIAMQHGRAAVLEFTIGGSREGDVQAYRLRVVQDAGAYPGLGGILPGFTALMSSGVYAIPKIEADTVSVVTNTTPIGPYRGAGRPEATQATRSRSPLHRGRPTTAATTSGRSTSRSTRLTTRACARSSSGGATRAIHARSGSVSARTSRSRTGSSSPSSERSRSRRTAAPSSGRDPSRTGKGTRRDQGRHRRSAAGRRDVRFEVDSDRRSRGRGCRRGRRGARSGPGRGAARGEQRRCRARCRGRRFPRRWFADAGADMGCVGRPPPRRGTA